MLVNLDFEVSFKTTDAVFKGSHNFQTGLSAITGKNEAGKSLRVELIRYALFGSGALRTSISKYETLNVTLEFKVGENTYVVTRNGSKKCNLTKEGKEVATGVTPVNTAIKKIFGYDLEVFDVANACLQGEVEAMTNKKPAQRKQMVDRTIGLDAIDDVIKKVNEDASVSKKALELINEKVIQRYEQPVKPDGLNDEDTVEGLEKSIDVLEKLNQRKHYIKGIVDSAFAEEPVKEDINDPVKETVDELTTQIHSLDLTLASIDSKKTKLEIYNKAKEAIGDIDLTLVKKFSEENYRKKWQDYEDYKKSVVPEPCYTQQDIDTIVEGNKIKRKLQQIELITCPKCSHEFDPHHDNVPVFDEEPYKKAVELVGTALDSELKSCEFNLIAYNKFREKTPVVMPDIDKTYDKPEVLIHYKNIEEMEQEGFNPAEAQLEIVSVTTDCATKKAELTAKLLKRKEQEAYNTAYEEAKKKYDFYITVKDNHKTELEKLEGVEQELESVKNRYKVLSQYLSDVERYESKMEAQAEAVQTKADLEIQLEMLGRVKKALVDLKPKVKTHLLPSLNKVSSHLISQMTNNARNKIQVTDDFDIVVDGQPVETLSGSGKAVANLAVRIGLGTVLTNKVFSVFLADEIDAAMDDERASYTAECLKNLTNTFKQIILVSHKQPDADHQIVL